jgi:di/tricarboxylate transporter
MSLDLWITVIVLAVTLGMLVWGRYPPSVIVFGATFMLLLTGVIDADQAFSGFSNTAPITVAALYVVAAAAQRTGLLSAVVASTLGRGGRGSSIRLLVPTAAASGFVNNTPLVAVLMPDVQAWARSRGVSASKYLLPLSYAAILGGVLTVIGTSTNLVVSGLLQETGADPIGIFEITKIGLPVAVVGMLVMLLVVPRLLPDRLAGPDRTSDDIREFIMEMRVKQDSAIAGKDIEEAGLRHLVGVYLVQISRRGDVIGPVAPTEVLQEGDVLTFAGQVDNVLDLQRMRGLEPAASEHLGELGGARSKLFEAVVGRASPIAGRTLKEAGFRSRYGAAVLAIHRAGQRIDAKLGDVRLRHGDTLILLAEWDFRQRWVDREDFLVVARLDGTPPAASRQAPIVALALVGFVLLSAFNVLSVVEGALLAAGVLIATRTISFADAKRAVDLDVVLLIGAAFGLGAAVETSGLAQDVADFFVQTFDGWGMFGIVLGVILATTLLTEVVTNNAAAAIVFPIAFTIAGPAGVDPRLMAMAIAIAASNSFITPIGYQTNTMVYGPGGYRFTDFVRVGFPVTIAVILTTTAMTTFLS